MDTLELSVQVLMTTAQQEEVGGGGSCGWKGVGCLELREGKVPQRWKGLDGGPGAQGGLVRGLDAEEKWEIKLA